MVYLKTKYRRRPQAYADGGAVEPQAPQASASLDAPRAERLDLWIKEGMDENHAKFFAENPAMIDRPEIAVQAAEAAHGKGLEPDSTEFFQFVKADFSRRLNAPSSPAPTAPMPEAPSPRREMSAGTYRERYIQAFGEEPPIVHDRTPQRRTQVSDYDPNNIDLGTDRVTLTQEEKAMARVANVSERDYAMGKLELMRRKARGEIQ